MAHARRSQPSDETNPNGRPCIRSLEQLATFPPQEDGDDRRYLRLEMDWTEWFYWMEAMGRVQICATNGWGVYSDQRPFSGWLRVPGQPHWIDPETGSEFHADQMGDIAVVEQSCATGFSLSCRVRHREGHEMLKLYLTHHSNLGMFEDMISQTAVPGKLREPNPATLPGPVKTPDVKALWRMWRGACRTMPTEQYAGLEPFARWNALSMVGEEFARPVAVGNLGGFFDQLAQARCGLQVTLYHPDHQTTVPLRLSQASGCSRWWHLFDGETKCHLQKDSGLRAWAVTEEPGTFNVDWIEIYHRPSRRLLAWLRPQEDPTDRVRWRRVAAGLL
ncbi:MAG: hypothetical protein AAGK14_02340 [Verrucomicrobiota bacterium]